MRWFYKHWFRWLVVVILNIMLLAGVIHPKWGVSVASAEKDYSLTVLGKSQPDRRCLGEEVEPPVAVPCIPEEQPSGAEPPIDLPVTPKIPHLGPYLLLPDLAPLPPSDLIIYEYPSTGTRMLRLSTSFANLGPGKLELIGTLDPQSGKTAVIQHVYSVGSTVAERPAGEFVFHPTHDHWHIENFVRYELWTLRADGSIEQPVALTDKVSFCLRDISQAGALGAGSRAWFYACGSEQQGISSGWVDTYRYDTPGQLIDISDLPDGLYGLLLVVDPDSQIWERSDTNNSVRVNLEIRGRNVRIVDDFSEVLDLLAVQLIGDPYD